jgi:hypothetical protein
MRAVHYCEVECVRLLLEAESDKEARDNVRNMPKSS